MATFRRIRDSAYFLRALLPIGRAAGVFFDVLRGGCGIGFGTLAEAACTSYGGPRTGNARAFYGNVPDHRGQDRSRWLTRSKTTTTIVGNILL